MLDEPKEQDSELEPVAQRASGEPSPSLLADVEALVEDGKTYAEAELAYQKTRLTYVSRQAKSAALYTLIAAALVVMAVVTLSIGAILALTPVIGAFGATAVVFVALVLGALLFGIAARGKIAKAVSAFESDDGQA
ncbi:MAG TPA: phage holin family protein [Sphingomonadaceae bacterium]|nr:phage holin family protein [Sphingomonadaceae bacterium]